MRTSREHEHRELKDTNQEFICIISTRAIPVEYMYWVVRDVIYA